MNTHKKKRNKFISVLAVVYPIFVAVYLVTKFQFANWSEFAVYDMHAHNIYPFRSIVEGFEQYGFLYLDILINIALFLPIGLLACTAKSRPSVIAGASIGIVYSFGIELLQYMLGTGILNIDDLIVTSLASLAGAIIYHVVKLFQKDKHGKQQLQSDKQQNPLMATQGQEEGASNTNAPVQNNIGENLQKKN